VLKGQDDAAFEAVMQDLCLAFNRPYTPDLSRVFWEVLRNVPIHEVRRTAAKHRAVGKKFPTPHELVPERAPVPRKPPSQQDLAVASLSPWAIAANRILFSVAYQGHRGFAPMGDRLRPCLARKADYVAMAEKAEREGDRWEPEEFNRMCREGFEQVLCMTANA
jgi:hypothetical protein